MSTGVPFMRDSLGSSARLSIELAWGADLAADPATWTWTEITGDVRGKAKVKIKRGRADESSKTQPATCSLVLDNTAGAYSLGPQSSNYPNVRRNVPIRVRVDPGDGLGFRDRFVGSVTGWPPVFDETGRDATVKLSAAGTLRRLGQGKSPVVSALRRTLSSSSDVVAYWPCEDPKGSQSIASGLQGGPPMSIGGTGEEPYPDFASNDSFVCSADLPVCKLTRWSGPIPAYTGTGVINLTFLGAMPEDPLTGTTAVLATLYTTGTITRWTLTYGFLVGYTGLLSLQGYDAAGAAVVSTGNVSFNVDNTTRRYQVLLQQVGADITWQMATIGVGYNSRGQYSGTATGQTLGIANGVTIGQDRTVDDAAIGHIAVQTTSQTLDSNVLPLRAYSGETVTARITRLCTENAVPLTITGSSSITMGPQPVSPLLDLLRECETADQGLLVDGRTAGLEYVTRAQRESVAPALTLDAATGEPARELSPADDDQRSVNKATASRTAGASATYEDASGPLGTDAIGVYDDSIKVNTNQDLDVIDYASWLVALGTVPGYRWPDLALDLAHKPHLTPGWLTAGLSARIDVTNISTVRPQLPTGTTSLLVEGYTETIDQFTWDVALNTSPYDPWRIGVLASTTGDTGEYVLRADSDGSSLSTGALAAATTLSVATPSGPLWTTAADDFPLDVEVAGQQVTVTAISGGSSPQTFTVAPLARAISSGAAVALWRPAVPGI